MTGADWIQLAIATFDAITAGAAWEATLTSRDGAKQIRVGHRPCPPLMAAQASLRR
jgi:hypothetical protein